MRRKQDASGMKADIMNILEGDEKKYNLIMQKTRQADIVKLRREVWGSLHDKKYTALNIAKFFGNNHATVLHGLNKISGDVTIAEIKSKIIKFR